MNRIALPFLILLFFLVCGCAAHSSRYSHRDDIQRCSSAPCGAEVLYNDMIINYSIVREPSGEHILEGTLTPEGAPVGAQIDFAVLSFDLYRDITVSDSFSFPLTATDASRPLPFKKRFTPSGGFDGITFNFDIHYK